MNQVEIYYIYQQEMDLMNICEFLLEEGIDPNETQGTKSTPLHGAAFYNQDSTVKLLL